MNGSAQSVAPPAAGEPAARRNGGHGPSRRRWVAAVVATVTAHVTGFLVFAVLPIGGSGPGESRPGVYWVGGAVPAEGSVINEHYNLFDGAPLFLPTRWNYASSAESLSRERAPGDIFAMGGARLAVDPTARPGVLAMAPRAVESAAEAVRSLGWPPLAAFGRRDLYPVVLEPRAAALEVRSVATGEVVMSRSLPLAEIPVAGSWPDWGPLEMLITVERPSAVMVPLISRSSGSEQADSFFRDYMRRVFRPDLRLPAGYYQVTIGP